MKWLLSRTFCRNRIDRYARWVKAAGVDAVRVDSSCGLPVDLESYAALLLTGGGDVNPVRYGEPKGPETTSVDDDRDRMEIRLIRRFLKVRKPIFGVCRGIQIVNVALGGKLIQHIPEFLKTSGKRVREEHRKEGDLDSVHPIRFPVDSDLRTALRGMKQVNSAHHQSIHPDAVSPNLRVTAVSPSGIIEAVEGQGLPSPVLAVQWHPERLDPSDPASGRLIELMISLCRRSR